MDTSERQRVLSYATGRVVRRWRCAVVAAGAACFLAILPVAYWLSRPSCMHGRADVTESRLRVLAHYLQVAADSDASLPEDLQELTRRVLSWDRSANSEELLTDGWDNPITLDVAYIPDRRVAVCTLRSPGPDALPETPDDIVHTFRCLTRPASDQPENQGQPPTLTAPTTQPATAPLGSGP